MFWIKHFKIMIILFSLFVVLCFIFSDYTHRITFKKTAEKNFVIVIPSYNNSQWYRYNLNSVFAQSYLHWRAIYIDDCSPDNTYALVHEYLHHTNQTERVTLLQNEKRKGALANHYQAIQLCKDSEIIVCLDGDDWFANDYVLATLAQIYSDDSIWMTYSQFCNWPTGQLGWSEEIPHDVILHNRFREFGFVTPQLRTYYAWLAKKVAVQDLQDSDGNFFTTAGDVALMFPLLEMASTHFKFIPEVLVQRNVATSLNVFKVNPDLQIKTRDYIASKKPYQPLDRIS